MSRRARCLSLVVGLVALALAIARGDAMAQMSRLYEFGPDAAELLPRERTGRVRPLPVPVELMAGTWRPRILASASALRLPPPPDDRATTAELRELRKHLVGDDAGRLERIRYWDTASPAHRWNEQLVQMARGDVESGDAIRAVSLLDGAIHDALIAAWDSKYAYRRPRPDERDGRLVPEVAVFASPSYPSEHAVVAGAAAGVLAHLFQADAERLAARAEEAAWSRVAAGAAYPSDVRAGLDLGRAVAARVIEYALLAEAGRESGPEPETALVARRRGDGAD